MRQYDEYLRSEGLYDFDDMIQEAVRILQECFPDKVIETVYAREILLGGGNIHCITQQVPKV